MNVLLTIDKKANGIDLESKLKKIPGINIIAQTENSIEVLYGLIQHQVDLMIIDNKVKSLSSKDCLGMVQKLNISVNILLLVDSEEEYNSAENPDCFAGYILRKDTKDEIIAKIESLKNFKPSLFNEPDEVFERETA